MRIVVQKFGGTSVVTAASRLEVVDRIKEACDQGFRVVAVVSAMGRAGDPYATDTLLGLLGDDQGAHADPRDRDLLLACGEIISCVVLAHTLRAQGVSAVALTGRDAGIVTDDNFGAARILRLEPERIRRHLREGTVVVVAGFQGTTEGGQVTTLGRGGSDTTAAVLGVALQAECIEFFKDVSGVYTADPRVVPDAKVLERLTYREIVEMAHLGAKVIHPRAVEIAMEGRIPVRIRSTGGEGRGTLVSDAAGRGHVLFDLERVVTGVAHVPERVQFRLPALDEHAGSRQALRLFESLGRGKISIDMIDVSETAIGFIVASTDRSRTERLLRAAGAQFTVREGLAKVSVVGAGMHGVPGVMARVMRALYTAEAPVFATADSHVNISCLVRAEDVGRVIRALHDEFALGIDHGREREATVDEAG